MNASKKKTPNTMQRIEDMEKALGQFPGFVQQVRGTVTQLQSGLEYVIQKAMAVEQSYASLAKTVTALVAELVESKTVDDHKILARIRELDAKAEKERIQSMLDEKVIVPSEVIEDMSLVAVRQAIQEISTEKGTREIPVGDYRLVEMGAPYTQPETKGKLLGLKVGETVEVARDEKNGVISVLSTTVLEIYKLAEGDRQGEEGTSPQESKEATPEEK